MEGGRIPRDDSSGNLIDNPSGNLIDNPYGNLIDNPHGNLIDNSYGNFNTFTDTSTSGNFTNEANLQIHLILANEKPIVSLVFGQTQLDTLMDTGASISLISGRAVRKFGLQTERKSKCTLEMAGGQKSTTDRWVSLQLEWANKRHALQAVVIEAPSRDFDLILGRPDQQRIFGDILFREDGSIRAIKDGQERDVPLKVPFSKEMSAAVQLDQEGESVILPDETEEQMKQLARDSLAKASFPSQESEWLHALVDSLPGLVRRHVIPASPLSREVKERAPKACIRVKSRENLPAHVPSQIGPKLARKLKDTIDELCKGGLLEPATSDVATRVMLIPKPNQSDELRLVCDYRDLNMSVEKDLYSVPRISTCLQNFEGRSVFSKLDLKSFFFQISLDVDSRPLTTITTPFGLFQWNVMPQGLTTSPAIAQRFIDWVLSSSGSIHKEDLRDLGVTAYIDDIAVATRTVDEHRHVLEKVLRRLHEHGVQLRFDKSALFVSRMSFLGHVVDAESDPGVTLIRADPKHTEAIKNFPTPTSATSLRRFLGMTTFLQRLVKGHACMADPLHELTKEGIDWHWDPKHEAAFQELKDALASQPFVALPNDHDPFVLRLDASAKCLGGALLQRTPTGEKVIAYISHKFSAVERNWSAWEKELYALVYAIKQYRYLLVCSDHPVTFMSDHKPLRHWRTLDIVSDKMVRWMDTLNSIPWTFEYVEGKTNWLADALSRPEDVEQSTTTFRECIQDNTRALCNVDTFCDAKANPASWGSVNTLVLPDAEFLRRIRDAYDGDSDGILEQLREGRHVELFSLEDGFIYRKSELPRTDAPKVLYIPRHAVDLWGEILRRTHEDIALHANADKTYHKLLRRWYWRNMKDDVIKLVKGCQVCNRNAPTTRRHYLPLAVPMPERCFSIVAVDQKVGLPMDSQRNDGYVVLIDFLSRLAILIPTSRSLSEAKFQKLLETHLFSKWGCPTKIVSDRGSNLASKLMRMSTKVNGFQHSIGSSGNPKTAGIAERAIRTTLDYLRKYVNAHAEAHPETWSEVLPAVEFAYNDSVNPRTYPWTPFMV